MKYSASALRGLKEILDAGGVVASGDWTTGRGNYVSKRVIPVLCSEFYAEDRSASKLRGEVGAAYRKLKRARPRIQKVIAVVDLRAARRAVA